jgi:hypothetical protein
MGDRRRAGAGRHDRRRPDAGGATGRRAAPRAAAAPAPTLTTLALVAGLATAVLVAAVAAALAAALVVARPAAAGGADWMAPARDRYEPGQTVTLLGFGQAVDPAWREKGPYYAYLRVDPARAEADAAQADQSTTAPYIHPTDVRVGEVLVEEAAAPPGTAPGGSWRRQRASVAFTLPDDLAPRAYTVQLCNDPCTAGLGYFWPEPVNVGVDPAYPIVRDWPLTDPAVRWLEDDALLVGVDGAPVTAADVRAGRVPTAPPTGPPAPPGPAVPAASPAPAPRAVGDGDGDGGAEAGGGPATATATGDDAGAGTAGAAGDAGEGDGGALAWWVVGEATVLVVGCALWRRRTTRRARPPLGVVPAGDAEGSSGTAADDGSSPRNPAAPHLAPADALPPDRRADADTRRPPDVTGPFAPTVHVARRSQSGVAQRPLRVRL